MEDEGPTPLDQLVAYKWLSKLKCVFVEYGNQSIQAWAINIQPYIVYWLMKRNKEAKITLWSDVAHSFSALSSEQLPKPIIVIFTSFRVKLFAGEMDHKDSRCYETGLTQQHDLF
ncbi:uncharacterized protein [Malus domestica]|uniref:uncharacterized protein n=1 Tax=Malus domestica TaxID=3750 RepID=UPI0039760B11